MERANPWWFLVHMRQGGRVEILGRVPFYGDLPKEPRIHMTNALMLILLENAQKNVIDVRNELAIKKRMGATSLQVVLDHLESVHSILEQGENLEKVQ
jgi:hypothetical protein